MFFPEEYVGKQVKNIELIHNEQYGTVIAVTIYFTDDTWMYFSCGDYGMDCISKE